MHKQNPVVLVILDGFGCSQKTEYNATSQANTPHLDALFKTYPHTQLAASGKAVGLLDGQIGNSEVGHITIGSGQIIAQPVTLLHQAIENGSFFTNTSLVTALKKLKTTNGRLHIMGLLSDAGVHAHTAHWHAFIKAAIAAGITNIFAHPFLDGRDIDPESAEKYLRDLEKTVGAHGCIASITGRFYAMDRGTNWERIQECYCMLTHAVPEEQESWQMMLHHFYQTRTTDEFVPPTLLHPDGIIKDGDGIIFTNFREDRARELIAAFVDPAFAGFERTKLDLAFFLTPVNYHTPFTTTAMIERTKPHRTLMGVLEHAGLRTYAIAETEKYAHVTYFFNGGREKPFAHEKQVMIPSRALKNYSSYPEMSAHAITAQVLHSLEHDPRDFYLINYANADMVGHSGNLAATIKAVECLDEQIGKLVEAVVENLDGTLFITADHGNAEYMFDEKTDRPVTAHTTNPVPFIAVKKTWAMSKKKLKLKGLSDIAGFILNDMGLE